MHNFGVMAHVLLNGEIRFLSPCSFKELGVAKRSRSTTSARSALRQPWSIIAQTNFLRAATNLNFSNRNCFKLLVEMITASPIARCPSFKFLTMQPSASWARNCGPFYLRPPCSQTSRTASTDELAQRFCVLTILPPVTALAVGPPAQRAIAQRFRALAPLATKSGISPHVSCLVKKGRVLC
jgi:hypothetical protein